jgi:hypothetical protein
MLLECIGLFEIEVGQPKRNFRFIVATTEATYYICGLSMMMLISFCSFVKRWQISEGLDPRHQGPKLNSGSCRGLTLLSNKIMMPLKSDKLVSVPVVY